MHPRHPSGETDYSRVVPCQCTRKELDSERQNRLRQYSNLGSLTRFTFDNINPQGRSGNRQSQERYNRAYEAARTFATEPKGWLVLGGPSGCGKSTLLHILGALDPPQRGAVQFRNARVYGSESRSVRFCAALNRILQTVQRVITIFVLYVAVPVFLGSLGVLLLLGLTYLLLSQVRTLFPYWMTLFQAALVLAGHAVCAS